MIDLKVQERLKSWMSLANFEDFQKACLPLVTDEYGELVPFVLNPVQKHVLKCGIEQLATLGRIDMIVLKARQMGVSTLIQAMLFWYICMNTYKKALIISYKDWHSTYLHEMQKLFYENSPIKPRRDLCSREGSTYGAQHNQIFVTTAGGKSIGHGVTMQFMHLSEISRWEESADSGIDMAELFAGFNQAIRGRKGSYYFLESTARGENYFKELWDDENNKERMKVFISWLAYPSYRMEITDTQADQIFSTPQGRYGDELREAANIQNELKIWMPDCDMHHEIACRLAWRRWMIDTQTGAGGNFHFFRQQYPTVALDAFKDKSFSVFDTHYLLERREQLVNKKDRKVWTIHHDTIDVKDPMTRPYTTEYGWHKEHLGFVPGGEIKVFKNPEPGEQYVIGADSCYGTDHDKAAFVVMNKNSLEEVASYTKSVDPDMFAEVLYPMGKAYNNALIAVEQNGPGGTTITSLQKLHYSNLYTMQTEAPWLQNRRQIDGFDTNSWSKGFAVSMARAAIRDRMVKINSPELIRQLLAYREFIEGKSKFGASGNNHDDLVMAFIVALYASGSIRTRGEVKKGVNPGSLDYFLHKQRINKLERSWGLNA